MPVTMVAGRRSRVEFIFQEKFECRWIFNENVQSESGSGLFPKYEPGYDRFFLNTDPAPTSFELWIRTPACDRPDFQQICLDPVGEFEEKPTQFTHALLVVGRTSGIRGEN